MLRGDRTVVRETTGWFPGDRIPLAVYVLGCAEVLWDLAWISGRVGV
jgi:hypothetical protein